MSSLAMPATLSPGMLARFPGRDDRSLRPLPPRRQGRDRHRRECRARRTLRPRSRRRGRAGRDRGPRARSGSKHWRAELRDAHVVACDLSLEGAPESFVAATLAHYGRVDVLVNNAGTSTPTPAFDESTDTVRGDIRASTSSRRSNWRGECARAMVAAETGGAIVERRVDLGPRRRRSDPRGGIRGVEGRTRQPDARAQSRSGPDAGCASTVSRPGGSAAR